jgi:response regulator RpfG family c-di-GMP phosphodiesterase
MMDRETLDVLAALAVTTAAMAYYARVYLPKKIADRTRESLKAFSTAVELRFPIREGLSNRVVALSREIGLRSDYSPKELERLEMAARLRDIGLCAVPYQLVNDKPFAEWTEADTEKYERHPEIGAAMLELAPSLRHLAGIVRTHQARYDGGSGPFFPSRENLPKESRLLKVVSDYVWLERTQGALLAKEALRDGAGTAYDPDVVYKLLALVSSARVSSPSPATVSL